MTDRGGESSGGGEAEDEEDGEAGGGEEQAGDVQHYTLTRHSNIRDKCNIQILMILMYERYI